MALASALPGACSSLIFLWTGDYAPKAQWTLTSSDCWSPLPRLCLRAARSGLVLPLQTISNLLARPPSGRRATSRSRARRRPRRRPARRQVMIEVNAAVVGNACRRPSGSTRSKPTTLLRKVIAGVGEGEATGDGRAMAAALG